MAIDSHMHINSDVCNKFCLDVNNEIDLINKDNKVRYDKDVFIVSLDRGKRNNEVTYEIIGLKKL